MSTALSRAKRTTLAPAWLSTADARDVSLLVCRIALAWVFIYHGAGTLFGAFDGPGLERMATFFASVAHLRPGKLFAVLNGVTEFFGGIAVGVGVLARLAAAGLVADMVIAMVTVTFANGIVSNAAGSGYELNLALISGAAVVAIQGAGRYSLAEVIRRSR